MRWFYLTNIICLILIYLAFISLKWIPLTFGLTIMVVVTVLGVEDTIYLIHFSNQNNLHDIREILNYLGKGPTRSQNYDKRTLFF